jgi:alpha-beta hydrolase superfamily lysophospholipase
MASLSIDARAGEPLAAWFSAERRSAGVREQRFECASGGDLVTGRYWLPDAAASALVIALHALGRDKHDPAVAGAAAEWASAGFATAAIDLPLHGERHNAKLSLRAIEAGKRDGDDADRALWDGLVAQAVRDLARALDALATRGALPQIVCVAFGDSAAIALGFASLDARVTQAAAIGAPRALALDLGAREARPLAWLARPADLALAR